MVVEVGVVVKEVEKEVLEAIHISSTLYFHQDWRQSQRRRS